MLFTSEPQHLPAMFYRHWIPMWRPCGQDQPQIFKPKARLQCLGHVQMPDVYRVKGTAIQR